MVDANGTDAAKKILSDFKTWAVVGCSADPSRAGNYVPAFLQSKGYKVIPVTPQAEKILGEQCYPDLASVPAEQGVEVVEIFRRSEQAGVHVDEAIAIGAKAVWMQLGVVDEEAASRAREAGLLVVMDRCPKMEHPRLIGT